MHWNGLQRHGKDGQHWRGTEGNQGQRNGEQRIGSKVQDRPGSDWYGKKGNGRAAKNRNGSARTGIEGNAGHRTGIVGDGIGSNAVDGDRRGWVGKAMDGNGPDRQHWTGMDGRVSERPGKVRNGLAALEVPMT